MEGRKKLVGSTVELAGDLTKNTGRLPRPQVTVLPDF